MVEVGLAMTVLVIALVALSATTARAHALRRQNREHALAQNALRTTAEEIQALARRAVAQDPASWSRRLAEALAPGGDFGPTFAVRELTPAPDEPAVGRVLLVVDERVGDEALGLPLGMPRDLDGDGLADSADVTDRAHVLPVLLRVRWSGVRGTLEASHGFWVVGF